jgi:hypothetical protein
MPRLHKAARTGEFTLFLTWLDARYIVCLFIGYTSLTTTRDMPCRSMVALTPYKYNRCVEPSILLTCCIPYEPLVAHGVTQKTIRVHFAVWERGQSVPSLFRKLSENTVQYRLTTLNLWTAMMASCYMPWPFRRAMKWPRNRRRGWLI